MFFGRRDESVLDDSRAPAIEPDDVPAGLERAAFAAGCFWGVEDVFREVPGVVDVVVGYEGGQTSEPTYEAVCTGRTGHAETALVTFDPTVVGYDALLEAFFRHHDPTTPNRQGPDVGTQYRSAVFTHGPVQERLAREALESYAARFRRPIVTEVVPATTFWPAEAYHQGFTARTGRGACHVANW
jgi:peptide-methionine (S)-S-oxide reductase